MSLTILDKIKAYKLQEVAADKASKPLGGLASRASDSISARGFEALSAATSCNL